MRILCRLFYLLLIIVVAQASAQVVEIPDPNLEAVIRETLELPDNSSITQEDMEQLTKLDAGGNRGITNLTGLEYATNLTGIELYRNPITDIGPFAHFTKLWGFNLWGCKVVDLTPLRDLKSLRLIILGNNKISDISPLTELTGLTYLNLSANHIVDFSPLSNLINLEKLFITDNLGTDFTPLQGLSLVEFSYDEVCDIAPLLPPVRERIESRNYPSVFAAWGGIGWSPVVNRPDLTDEEQLTLHDLHFSPHFGLNWDTTVTEPAYGIAIQRAGSLDRARQIRQQRLDQNPNMVFLFDIRIHNYIRPEAFPPNSDFWFRSTDNQIIQNHLNEYMIDFRKPEVQDLLIERVLAIERCGLYDGIMFDGFNHNGTGFVGRNLLPITDEEIIQAMLNLFHSIRAQVRDDFLILINANRSKATRYAEFVNGTFMETLQDYPSGYTHEGIKQIESTLLWSEDNLREPQINCLEGWGIPTEAPDSPNNLRWMRVFTSMSLTHSDGYIMYNIGTGHKHFWYSFWDTDLGNPIGPKAQRYQNVEGLFIREFTNGWAVYNRSGKPQEISLPAPATAVGNGDLRSATTHQLPDLDGEIYLTTKSFADVNDDGRINILDVLQVANNLGQASPDPNGDGVVDILDLVFVAQQFSE